MTMLMATHKQFLEWKDQVMALIENGVNNMDFIAARLGDDVTHAVDKETCEERRTRAQRQYGALGRAQLREAVWQFSKHFSRSLNHRPGLLRAQPGSAGRSSKRSRGCMGKCHQYQCPRG